MTTHGDPDDRITLCHRYPSKILSAETANLGPRGVFGLSFRPQPCFPLAEQAIYPLAELQDANRADTRYANHE